MAARAHTRGVDGWWLHHLSVGVAVQLLLVSSAADSVKLVVLGNSVVYPLSFVAVVVPPQSWACYLPVWM